MIQIEDCISFLLGKAGQRVIRRARELLVEHGVTPVQYAALCVLWEQDGQTAADLGSRLVIDSATMTGIIDRLERDDLITRRPDESDRRASRLYLSRRGKALKAPLDAAMEVLNLEVATLLGSDSAGFLKMLRKIGASG